jgi:hypothetical protein
LPGNCAHRSEAALSPGKSDCRAGAFKRSIQVLAETKTEDAIEKRRSPRRRVLKAGTIVSPHIARTDCTVRNLSDGGACLEVAAAAAIPDHFDLFMTTDRSAHACRVAWRSEARIGVEFQ